MSSFAFVITDSKILLEVVDDTAGHDFFKEKTKNIIQLWLLPSL
jgi:hypothetical protein